VLVHWLLSGELLLFVRLGKKFGMSQTARGWHWRLKLASYLIMYTAIATSDEQRILAQIASDNTLGSANSTVSTIDPVIDRIDGGAIAGKNLFHSFQKFNISEGRGAYFANPAGIENIISRVTGGKASDIQGRLGVLGNANLFLLNPSGIIFGRNASLDMRGSFVASTASSLKFADGVQFSTTDAQTSTLLTVSVPLGLHFGATPQNIINRSQASPDGAVNNLGLPVGLQVQTGKSLLLVGGDISLEGGNLTVEGGRIELGSVAGNNLVNLNPVPQGWNLGYEGVRNFQNIQLSQRSILDASGAGGGSIQIQGKDIFLKDASRIFAETKGTGDGGDIRIDTRKLIIQDGSQISTASSGFYLSEPPYIILAQGKGGDLTVNASESVELNGTSPFGIFSGLSSATFSAGNAGDITVNTRKLIVRDGGRITTDSSDVILPEQRIPATGKGGNLTVNASESMELTNGLSNLTGLFTATRGSGDAGNLSLSTETLIVRNGAEVAVNSEGIGNVGNLNISANSIRVENGGKLTATSKLSSDGGNINLQNLDLLTLRNNGEISTSAQGAGNGGNINIDTDNLVLAERSNITARAVDGRGGNISITTQGLFVSPDSTIDASSDRGINGIVEIKRPDVDPSAELVILPADVVDVSGLIAKGCSVSGGVASGESSFAITGRGGLPPTPAEATRSESVLADLGIAEKSSGRLPNGFGNISRVKVRSQKSKAIPTAQFQIPNSLESSNKVNPAPLVEATGWVVGSNGEVVLTAAVTTDTLNIPWFRPHRCNGT